MSGILIITWDGGGNVPPTLGLAAELVRRGHQVRVLGHPQQADSVRASGAVFEAYEELPSWDPSARTSFAGFVWKYPKMFTDRRFGDAARAAIARHRPDAVVVDVLLTAAVDAAVSSATPTIVMVHTLYDFIVSNFAKGPVGLLSALKGSSLTRSLGSADALVISSTPALARRAAPSNAHLVGPIFGPGEAAPTEADPESRRILVSLSTISYVGMLGVLQRIVDAVADLSDVVVTTGSSIDPSELRTPANVVVRRQLSHTDLLAQTALVIGHGGHGTTTKALTAGVPLVIRPMTALGDQTAVAAAVERAGVGVRLGSHDSVEDIRRAVDKALHDQGLRERARGLGRQLRATDGAARAADVVETAARAARATRPPQHHSG
jgi:UDP:flavonoid glycosyltransferase YjiC (YdhE family)